MSEVKMTKGTETLASLSYSRDNNGQVKTIISKGLPGEEKPSYEYDVNSRLTKVGTASYEYDATNDPTKIAGSGAYTYSAADELEAGPSAKYTYDEVGERTKTTPTSGAATTYRYNQAGDLVAVERPKEGKTAEIKDLYAHNGDGLRISETVSGKTTYIAWDSSETVPLILNDGVNSYIYGAGGLPIEQINNESKVLYLHHDQQGSTRMLTGATGKSEATFTYDPYGNLTGTAGTAITPLGYDAQYTNADTGLIYLRARTYDPKTAQFVSVDPLASQTHQPYTYAGDNPLSGSDITGMCGVGSVGEALESVNPFSSENCAYQAVDGLLKVMGVSASALSNATAVAAIVLGPIAPPVAVALGAVSAAAGAYATGEDVAKGDALASALDGLGSVLGGAAAAGHFLAVVETWAAEFGSRSDPEAMKALAEMLDKAGYGPLAGSVFAWLAEHQEVAVVTGC